MYRVLTMFHDLTDVVHIKGGVVCHAYHEGDIYPRAGMTPSPERIEALLSGDNARGIPLIEEIRTEVSEAEPETEEAVKKPADTGAQKARRTRKKAE